MEKIVEDNLQAIRAASNPAHFPRHRVGECRTAAGFFCAAFLGRNDIINLHDEGLRDAWLIDIDADKLAEMARLYGNDRTITGDAFAIAAEMAGQGRQFDMVITDPFTSLMKRCLEESGADFTAITARHWVHGISGDMLGELGIATGLPRDRWLGAIDEWIKARINPRFAATELVVRNDSDYCGGIFWLVLSRRAPD